MSIFQGLHPFLLLLARYLHVIDPFLPRLVVI